MQDCPAAQTILGQGDENDNLAIASIQCHRAVNSNIGLESIQLIRAELAKLDDFKTKKKPYARH